MAAYDNAGRISKTNFIVASVILFVLSVVFTIGRIIIRLRYQKSLAVDDAFLIFAVVCLCVATGLLFAFLSSMYLLEALITDDPNATIPMDIIDQVEWFRALSTAFLVLTFTTIFAVKFSFLFLFKALIRNVRKMKIYWWTVVSTTAAVWAFGVVEFFLPCPTFGAKSLTCAQDSEYSKALGWSAGIIVQDVLTDLMIIVIPVLLLWRVRIKLQQKLALGLSLCLSIIMIITAIVQISGIHAPTNTIDVTWEIFWQLMEACIAVIMVSLTAFRSLFVAHGSGAKSPPQKLSLRKRVLNSRIIAGRKRAGGNDSEEMERLPEIPRATLTGMRTFIRGNGTEGSVMKSEASGDTQVSWPLENESANKTIRAEHEMSQKSQNVSFDLFASSYPYTIDVTADPDRQASPHTRNSSDHQFV
ncbi:hypothetical protein MMC29_006076 [Sticta canariensis]|nr:hypothetical protein [Sticta canariensis]